MKSSASEPGLSDYLVSGKFRKDRSFHKRRYVLDNRSYNLLHLNTINCLNSIDNGEQLTH